MFDQTRMRLWIAIGWLSLFITMWFVFDYGISREVLVKDVRELEEIVGTENWSQATHKVQELEKHWNERKIPIQTNNATTDVRRFTTLLTQVKTLIHYEEDDVLMPIGEMKDVVASITEVFPAP